MAGGTRTRHVVLLFTVLAGLFLMHGLSAPSMHGMSMPAAMPAAMPAHTNAPTADSSPDPMPDHAHADMTCIPLRPEGTAGLFLALCLIVMTLWRPRLSHSARLILPYLPHGPPRTGVQVLRTLSISRT
jgi:hypothetical protein